MAKYRVPVGVLYGIKIDLVSSYEDNAIDCLDKLKNANEILESIAKIKQSLLNDNNNLMRWEYLTKEQKEVYEEVKF